MNKQQKEKEIAATHRHGVAIKAKIVALLHLSRALEALNRHRRTELARIAPVSLPVTMYDSVTVSEIPGNARAVAGYVGGKWPTFGELSRRFPHAHRLSIAVNAGEDADCLDVETGDATPGDAPGWFHRQRAKGKKTPCLYANRSTMPAVLAALRNAGISRNEYRLWEADYTGREHLNPGMDACQWSDRALGKNLDVSVCRAGFFT